MTPFLLLLFLSLVVGDSEQVLIKRNEIVASEAQSISARKISAMIPWSLNMYVVLPE